MRLIQTPIIVVFVADTRISGDHVSITQEHSTHARVEGSNDDIKVQCRVKDVFCVEVALWKRLYMLILMVL